ncbi:MAG: hypothetical protein HY689_09105 [Chloroflexi bacterium]|nr:hypothetical protein [Chloroflexota bacterium]
MMDRNVVVGGIIGSLAGVLGEALLGPMLGVAGLTVGTFLGPALLGAVGGGLLGEELARRQRAAG